jgi:hypothetical protein
LNVADDREIGHYVADAVADLESQGVDSIVVAFSGLDGLDGLSTEAVPLMVSLADECVSTFRYRADTAETGEVKEAGVYYLTRGHIDRAVDGYKLYRAYRGRVEALTDRFDEAAAQDPDLRIDWADSRLYERALERGAGMSGEAVDRFFGTMFEYYDTVELIDTGTLGDLHRWYGQAFADFLTGLREGDEVEFRVEPGDMGLLELLLEDSGTVQDSPYVAVFDPGESVRVDSLE